MLYSVLIYDSEPSVDALPEEEHNSRLQQHLAFQEPFRHEKQLGAVVKLMGTGTAVTLPGGQVEDILIDGPFAETKEQLIGFYLVNCDSLEDVIEAAKKLPRQSGSIEVRPVSFFEGGNFQKGMPLVLGGS